MLTAKARESKLKSSKALDTMCAAAAVAVIEDDAAKDPATDCIGSLSGILPGLWLAAVLLCLRKFCGTK